MDLPKATLETRGFAVVDCLDARLVGEGLAAYQKLSRPVQGFDSTILSPDPSYRAAVDAAIRRIVQTVVERLLPAYRIAFCTFAVKAAGSPGSKVPMHQDWTFVDERQGASLGFWAPLADVGPHNGCLQVIPCSHQFTDAPRGACTPFAYPEIVAQLEAECLETISMKAGEAVLFDNRLFHCSPPNTSATERIAMTALLVPGSSKMRYYHVINMLRPNELEVFEVDDEFYLRHVPGLRPVDAQLLGVVDVVDREGGLSTR